MHFMDAEIWKRLLTAAKSINKLKPWVRLGSDELFGIQLATDDEPVYLGIMGQMDETYGVTAYLGSKGINGLRELLDSALLEDVDSSFFTHAMKQSALCCYFSDRDELEENDRQFIKIADMRFRGQKQWPMFRSLEEGLHPWYLTDDEALKFALAMENFLDMYDKFCRGEINIDLWTEMYMRVVSDDGFTDSVLPSPLNDSKKMYPVVVVDDELFLARLRKVKKRSRKKVEFDSFYLPFPTADEPDSRPYFMRLTLLLDHEEGMILDQRMTKEPSEHIDAIIDMLSGLIEEHGRPSVLLVRNQEMETLLSDFAGKTNLRITGDEGCPAIDNFYEMMLNFEGFAEDIFGDYEDYEDDGEEYFRGGGWYKDLLADLFADEFDGDDDDEY